MARKGANKKRCEKYKMSGHKEENKKLRQLRHQKRMDRFAKRREEGKVYQYSKERTNTKIDEYYGDGFSNKKFFKEKREDAIKFGPSGNIFAPNKNSNRAMHTPLARWTSAWRKLNNQLSAEAAAAKAAKSALEGKGNQ